MKQTRFALFLSLLLSALFVDGKLNCTKMRGKATSLAASCCRLTRPSLDPEIAACREQLDLPKNRKFNSSEQYAINMCVEECSYIASGYIEIDPPFQLDMAIVKRNLDDIMPEPQEVSVRFMVDAFVKCRAFRAQHAKLFAVQLPEIEFNANDCASFALDMTICVRIHSMQRCPKEFYMHHNTDCQMARKYFTQCVADIEANISN